MKFIACLFVIIGFILMIFGFITFLKGSTFLGVGYAVNYYHAATSFLLLAICCKLVCSCKKEKE